MGKRVLSVLWIVLLVFLVSLFLTTIYILYLNWPGELQEFTFIGSKEKDINYSTSQQFYENMRFSCRICKSYKERIVGNKHKITFFMNSCILKNISL